MSTAHIIGVFLTLGMVLAASIWSIRKVKDGRDFTMGGARAGSLLVAGSIVGTLVGGSSTIGTAQLAHQFGHSALWFTLGGSIGCLVLGVFFARPLRRSGKETIQQIITGEYGEIAGLCSAILGTIGIFLNVVAQLLSSMVLLESMFVIPPLICALVSAGIMACYVLFGGVQGIGLVGTIKMALLYVIVIVCGSLALSLSGGLSQMAAALPRQQYFNLFARGFGVDAGAGVSLVLGVLSTQTYAQAVLSAKSDKAAIRGSLLSALLIPPIGLGGVYIGMYMKLYHPEIVPGQAFPQFIMMYTPGLFAGVALATLFIAVVGTGAGLSLGIASIFTNNLYNRIYPNADSQKHLLVSRVAIICVLLLALLFTVGDLQAVILQWGFMSMGLRAAVVFLPMCGAMFLSGKINSRCALAAIICGPLTVLLGHMSPLKCDPLFLGIAVGFICMALSAVVKPE